MALVVAMGDDITHLDPTLSPLFDTYNLSPSDVEVIVSKNLYDSDKTRSLKHRNLMRASDGNLVADLKKRGIPDQDAMFFAQGLEQGKDLILVNVDGDGSKRVADYFKHNRMTETAGDMKMATPPQPKKTQAKQANVSGDETFEVVEEDIRVGKRTVEKGGVRVEKHVTTTPVREEVKLKEERAVVHREKVNRPANPNEVDAAFKEATYEIREYKQEAVVEKSARVVEEVSLGKVVEEDVQVITDELRRIDVDIKRIDTADANMRYETMRPAYEKHYKSTYSDGPGFDRYERAYRFGHAYATEPRTSKYSYNSLEPRMKEDWNSRYDDEDSAWENVKDAVSHAWTSVRNKVS